MIANLESAACLGIAAYPIRIEVDVASGLPQFTIVGLPDQSVKESRERVRSAIKNSGFSFPPDRITINLAPADLRKEGPAFDLPIALGILAAQGLLPLESLAQYVFLGELALDGSLRGFKGAVVAASSLKKKSLVISKESAAEASLDRDVCIYPVQNLKEAVALVRGELTVLPAQPERNPALNQNPSLVDFSEVKGQSCAKRALEIAVAGGHNLLLIGPPGSGKSMLARRVPTILPALEFDEALEITKIYSVSGLSGSFSLAGERPFRAPHHSISPVALAGGGSFPRPGEISLSHGGVLFLDEFPEFRRDVLEVLRAPMEDGSILISRAKSQIMLPARFMLVAAMNPCPCGYLGDRRRACRCHLGQVQKYQAKVSGPILDRLDLHVEVPALSYSSLSAEVTSENSASIRARIQACRSIQRERFQKQAFALNSGMRPKDFKILLRLSLEGKKLLESAMKELRLSARAYYKVLKVSRTIGDLAGTDEILEEHVAEAVQYRNLDRQWWT